MKKVYLHGVLGMLSLLILSVVIIANAPESGKAANTGQVVSSTSSSDNVFDAVESDPQITELISSPDTKDITARVTTLSTQLSEMVRNVMELVHLQNELVKKMAFFLVKHTGLANIANETETLLGGKENPSSSRRPLQKLLRQ